MNNYTEDLDIWNTEHDVILDLRSTPSLLQFHQSTKLAKFKNIPIYYITLEKDDTKEKSKFRDIFEYFETSNGTL